MLRNRAYKYRIYPDEEQRILINKSIGSARYVYNYFLKEWERVYKETGKGLTYYKCSSLLTSLKKEEGKEFLKEVDNKALQNSLKDLERAYKGFFTKKSNYPKIKTKRKSKLSYSTNMTNNNIRVEGNKIKLPKLGFVKFANSKEIKGRIIRVTVTLRPSGKYFISVLAEEDIQYLKKANSVIGLDLGITHFAILSNGDKHDNNRFTYKYEKELTKAQKILSRRRLLANKRGVKLEDAKNYQKQRIKVARLHEKISNQREDFLNKLSTSIIENQDIICIENLNIRGMLKNRKLSKAISDVSWSKFLTKLEYKAKWYGKKIIKIDRWFPSSKKCSNCGNVKKKLKLQERVYDCGECGISIDRDINAGINILNEGLSIDNIMK